MMGVHNRAFHAPLLPHPRHEPAPAPRLPALLAPGQPRAPSSATSTSCSRSCRRAPSSRPSSGPSGSTSPWGSSSSWWRWPSPWAGRSWARPSRSCARAPGTLRWVVYFFGTLLFLLLIAGLVLIVILLVREVRLNERQTNFVSAVTHELKTPVASLKLYLDTLRLRDLPEEPPAGVLPHHGPGPASG